MPLDGVLRRRAVGEAGERGVLRPVVSGDGGVVAFTERDAGTTRQRVACSTCASRHRPSSSAAPAPTGAEADRPAGDASISDDGTRIAFVSAATNLDPAKPDDTRGVFVRDTRPAPRR